MDRWYIMNNNNNSFNLFNWNKQEEEQMDEPTFTRQEIKDALEASGYCKSIEKFWSVLESEN